MKIEEQLINFNQAQKLEMLGIKQECRDWFYEYKINGTTDIRLNYVPALHEIVNQWAAFNVCELGVMMANKIRLNCMNYTFRANLEKSGLWHLKYRTLSRQGKCIPLYQCKSNNEADARAKMLIYLLENNFLKADDCNKRLIGSNKWNIV